jgi:hypothetical protein
MYSAFGVEMCALLFRRGCFAGAGAGAATRRGLVCPSPVLFKDKPSGATKGTAKKSKFLRLDENGEPLNLKKERSEEAKKKLEEARASRELKKKEIRANQLAIQKKRDVAAAAKKKAKDKNGNEDDN